jgi:hypothetical protein
MTLLQDSGLKRRNCSRHFGPSLVDEATDAEETNYQLSSLVQNTFITH